MVELKLWKMENPPMTDPTDAAVEALATELRPIYCNGGNYLEDRLKGVARHVLTRQPTRPSLSQLSAADEAVERWCGARSQIREMVSELNAALEIVPAAEIERLTARVRELEALTIEPRPMTEADVVRIAEETADAAAMRRNTPKFFRLLNSDTRQAWIDRTRDTLSAASWPMVETVAPEPPVTEESTRDTLILLNDAIAHGRREGMAGQYLGAMCSARDEIERIYAELASACAERDKWKCQAFAPIGDNHHNAMLCPHCNPSALAAAQSGTIRLGEGLTEAQEGWAAQIKLCEAENLDDIGNAMKRFVWRHTVQGFDYWRDVYINVERIAAALRASATPKPEAVDWVKIARDYMDNRAGNYVSETIIEGLCGKIDGLCEQIAALRAAGGV
jgi:hypothetical protein